MEQIFIKRAIELVKEIQKEKDIKIIVEKLGMLEGYLTGALEIFGLVDKIPKE